MLITIMEAAEMSGISAKIIRMLINQRRIFPAERNPAADRYHGESIIMMESEDIQDWLDILANEEEPESEIADRHLKHICKIYAPDKDGDIIENLIRRKSGRIYRWLNRRVFVEGTFEDTCRMIRLKSFFKITGDSFDAN